MPSLPSRGVEDLAHQIETGDGRPFAAVAPELRAQLASFSPKDPAQRIVVKKAQNYRLTNNTTSFEINAPSAGLAVLMEANVPGDIRAFVDGRTAPCLTVNHAFRGVFIEQAGRHVVKFAYWPRVLGPALWVAGVGMIALLLSVWFWFRAGRRHYSPVEMMTAECGNSAEKGER